ELLLGRGAGAVSDPRPKPACRLAGALVQRLFGEHVPGGVGEDLRLLGEPRRHRADVGRLGLGRREEDRQESEEAHVVIVTWRLVRYCNIAYDIIQEDRMRLVLDTDVVVAAMRSDRGASRQLLLAALDQRIVALASVPLMLEYE